MKLYKNTLIISIIAFLVCALLSVIFEFTCMSKYEIISFCNDYLIGIACSIIVVIITTFLQFKYEQKKAMSAILSEVQFFLFHYLLIVISLDPNETTPDKLWEYYYDETYNGVRKISSELSNIEWFSKKKIRTARNLQTVALQVMIDMAKFTDGKTKDSMLYILDKPWLKEIKDNAISLANTENYVTNEILKNYERIQQELNKLKFSSRQTTVSS